MLVHANGIITYLGIGTLGRGWDVFDGLNATDKSFISMFMEHLQIPGSKGYEN